MNTNPIDFVILWVDGNDPAWLKEKKKYQRSVNPECSLSDQDADSLMGVQRFRDWGLLQYWFRGIEKHAPWVHRIYFVTWGHVPKWLNLDHPKLEIVRHEDFIPAEYLPTFNSNTILLNLHRIKGLSEQFVVFNDDMYLTRDTKPEDFFVGGLPKEEALLDAAVKMDPNDEFAHLKLNNAGVINRHFNKKTVQRKHAAKFFYPGYGCQLIRTIMLLSMRYFSAFRDPHVSHAFRKQSYESLWKIEPEILDQTCRHKFRSLEDVTEWLIKDWQLCEGNFVPRNHRWGRKYELGADDKKIVQALLKRRFTCICINDGNPATREDWDKNKAIRRIAIAFERIFPEKSSFEIEI